MAATLRAMDIRAFEDIIKSLPGIETVRVITDGGEPSEVHVLAQPGKPAKQLVRDIQSVAQAPDARPVVIVHGAYGGGWDWRTVEAELRDGGHDVYRVTPRRVLAWLCDSSGLDSGVGFSNSATEWRFA